MYEVGDTVTIKGRAWWEANRVIGESKTPSYYLEDSITFGPNNWIAFTERGVPFLGQSYKILAKYGEPDMERIILDIPCAKGIDGKPTESVDRYVFSKDMFE
jgi:hypothetical protein